MAAAEPEELLHPGMAVAGQALGLALCRCLVGEFQYAILVLFEIRIPSRISWQRDLIVKQIKAMDEQRTSDRNRSNNHFNSKETYLSQHRTEYSSHTKGKNNLAHRTHLVIFFLLSIIHFYNDNSIKKEAIRFRYIFFISIYYLIKVCCSVVLFLFFVMVVSSFVYFV